MAFNLTKPPSSDDILEEKGFLTAFWRKVFNFAKENGASDIHVESLKDGLHVRFRIKGTLIEPLPSTIDKNEMVQLVDKFKEIACLDTSTRRILQDSAFSLRRTNSTYRVSLSPGYQNGECAVVRIINNDDIPSLESIDLSIEAKKDILTALNQKQGLFLVTGPTGSGKSTTLQACISAMDTREKKVISIENPPERLLPGVVHEIITNDYTWSDAIKGAMRQDPDVILVGEIRDKESAKLAIEAAQTGHLVLSTLHTNNVPATVTRLMTLGIEKYLIADALLFVSAQRLLKRLCEGCKMRCSSGFYRSPMGCELCLKTGYMGRIPIFEYCFSPPPELIYSFDTKNFSNFLTQSLAGETAKLISKGFIDFRLGEDFKPTNPTLEAI